MWSMDSEPSPGCGFSASFTRFYFVFHAACPVLVGIRYIMCVNLPEEIIIVNSDPDVQSSKRNMCRRRSHIYWKV